MKTTSDHIGGCGRHELLVTVLYGEATETERTEFEAHRRACPVCEDEFEAFTALRGTIASWELEALPAIRVEVRPSVVERLKQALVLLPTSMRLAAAGACAFLVLAVFNTEVSIGQGGVGFRVGLLPSSHAIVDSGGSTVQSKVTDEQIEQVIAERCDKVVEMRLAAYRTQMDAQLGELQTRLASANSADDIKRLTVQIAAQRKRIESLQRDLDRTAGYGGTDLFSAVLGDQQPGS